MVIANAEAPETVLSRTLSARSAKLERETQVGGAGGAYLSKRLLRQSRQELCIEGHVGRGA